MSKVIHESRPPRYVIEYAFPDDRGETHDWRVYLSFRDADEAILQSDDLARRNPGERYRVVDKEADDD